MTTAAPAPKLTTNKNNAGETMDDRWKDVDVVHTGSKIILPEGPPAMSYDDGIEWLKRKKAAEEQTVQIHEQIEAHPLDGAYAFARCIARKYGFAGLIPTPGWFSEPPVFIGVSTGFNQTSQVPWGAVQIPGIEGYLQTAVAQKDGRQVFVILGEVKSKFKGEINLLANMVRDMVKTNSIYRGKAVKVAFPPLDPRNYDPTTNQPKFLDTDSVKVEELVFPKDVDILIKDALFTPIEKTELCRKFKVPLKRGVLLEGPYGTGKTLTAYVTAKKAVDNEWTFIYLTTVKDLARAIPFAKQYAPAVIFAEDIDNVLKGNRDEEMNQILNTIDGVDTKNAELITVLTTNHVDLINPAMLRPGRLDAVIPVRPPDPDAVMRLIQLYARGLVPAGEDLTEVGELMNGKIPAVIREVVERSKLSAIGRLGADDVMSLSGTDLANAAKSILAQDALIKMPAKEPHPMEVFGAAAGREIALGLLTHKYGKQIFSNIVDPEVVASAMEQAQADLGSLTNGAPAA